MFRRSKRGFSKDFQELYKEIFKPTSNLISEETSKNKDIGGINLKKK